MEILHGLTYALCGLFAVGCIVRLITLGLTMAAQPEEKTNCIKEGKNVLVAFAISLVVGVAPIIQNIIVDYFA